MKLSINNQTETKNVPTAQVTNPAAATAATERTEKAEYAEYVEVKEEPKAKKSAPKKSKAAPKKSAPKTNTSAVSPQTSPSYTLVTYETKKGGTGSYVMGFKTEAEAKALADNACKTVNATWRYNDKGEKVYGISFGVRYILVAKALCRALNAGDKAAVAKAIAETHEVYSAAVAAGKAEDERKRQERKAQEAKAKADEVAKVKKENGLYTAAEMAEFFKRAMAGEDVPELAEVKKLLKVA